jgi:excisionase family DNA binding protein
MTTLLTAEEVAAVLNVSKRKAYDLAASGDLTAVRMGACVRVHPDDLAEYIERQRELSRRERPASPRLRMVRR